MRLVKTLDGVVGAEAWAVSMRLVKTLDGVVGAEDWAG